MDRKQVRRAQTLTPFGVGAIIDIEGESLVAADITRWRNGEDIHEPRLERMLGVEKFKMGPAAPNSHESKPNHGPGIPYIRFPQWLFCPSCRKMDRWSISRETGEPPTCSNPNCKGSRLVPMRFVMACPAGHLADVPWRAWAHSRSKATTRCEQADLEFRTKPSGSGLEHIEIYCSVCRASRSIEEIATPDSLVQLYITCPGRHPWQTRQEETDCKAVPQVLQRGATNLTFAQTISSIDIPPYSDVTVFSGLRQDVIGMSEYDRIKEDPSGPFVESLVRLIASKLRKGSADIRRVINAELHEQGKGSKRAGSSVREEDLLRDEFNAFMAPDKPDKEVDLHDHFIKRRVSLNDNLLRGSDTAHQTIRAELLSYIDTLIQVTRLREVRVLQGFSRLAPTSDTVQEDSPGMFSVYGKPEKMPSVMVRADLNGLAGWLPAIEVFGEGIFLKLDEPRLQEWENRKDILARTRILQERHERSWSRFIPQPTPRLLLLHTLAHLLIRQLSFECGYTLASLRERIYAAEPSTGSPMAGILIYTAAGDAEGTLGGLVREGEAERMLSTVIKALQTADWCSSDPLCRESWGQGMDAMNLAACHTCALLPETSCFISNRVLDRAVLIGSLDHPELGFLSQLMERILQTMGAE